MECKMVAISLKEVEALEVMRDFARDFKLCYLDDEEDDPEIRKAMKEHLKTANKVLMYLRKQIE